MTDHPSHSTGDDTPLILPAPVDLRRLDAARDPSRFDGIVRSITAGAIAERARLTAERAFVRRGGVLYALATWSRPAFAAAALVLVIAGASLALLPTPAVAASTSLVESAGVPRPLVEWSAANHSPTAAELVNAFEPAATRSAP